MASLHPQELDSGAVDSVTSSPLADHLAPYDPCVRFMCSFGGKILPRPHDNLLRYVGGDTRMVAVHRSTTFHALQIKLSKLSGVANVCVKYQLPNEDLDALISVTTDEDVENMMEEFDRFVHNQNPRSARLRLFLFSSDDQGTRVRISSLLDGSANREHWFFDSLNSGSDQLERGRSEASSIVSEVPDYLFGLDNSDEAQPTRESKMKARPVLHDNISASDPGSPAPVVFSPYGSTSSAMPTTPSIPYLPPVKTKPDNPEPIIVQPKQNPVEAYNVTIERSISQPPGYPSNPVVHYVPDSHYNTPPVQQVPVYYIPSPITKGNVPPVQPVSVGSQYVQQYPVHTGQVPTAYPQMVHQGMGQVYTGPGVRPVATADQYEAGRVKPEVVNQQVYYGVPNLNPNLNPGIIPVRPGMVIPGAGGEDLQRTGGPDPKLSRVSQS